MTRAAPTGQLLTHASTAGAPLVHPGQQQPPGPGDTAAAAAAEEASGSGRGGPHRQADARADAGLKLWREWAAESLGPMAAGPTDAEEQRSASRIKRLEQKCAQLAANAQRRLALSAAIRTAGGGWGTSGRSPSTGGNLVGQASVARQQGGKEAAWSARERRRSAAYASVRSSGELEGQQPAAGGESSRGREMWGTLASSAGRHAAGDRPMSPLASHEMLNGLLDTGGSPAAFHTQVTSSGRSLGGIGSITRLVDAAPAGKLAHVQRSPTVRPWSSPNAGSQAAASARRSGGAPHMVDASMLRSLQQERDQLAAQLEDAQQKVEVKSEVESQLREALDVLRARVAAQGARELDAQRRLQAHARLEPIFDKLAECFMFRSAEEVVERLQFLEDERLGSFDELLRAQEDIASLQHQLNAALSRVEITRTQVTSQQLEAAGKLQSRNTQLQSDLEQLQSLNKKLEVRQAQLISLQGAVIDLWSCCEKDASFLRANSQTAAADASASAGPGGSGGRAAAGAHGDAGALDGGEHQQQAMGGETGDLEGMLSLIKELLVAKSPEQAAHHYQSMQQVAHRVWAQHFTHKPSLRGKVVETFEALSGLAQIMATKIRAINSQLERSRQTQKNLVGDLERLQLRNRALEVALARRDALVRDMSGVPRSQRPSSAAAYERATVDETWMQRVARASSSASLVSHTSTPLGGWRSQSPKPVRPHTARPGLPPGGGGGVDAGACAWTHAPAPAARGTLAPAQLAAAQSEPGMPRPPRPSSAPAQRRAMHAAVHVQNHPYAEHWHAMAARGAAAAPGASAMGGVCTPGALFNGHESSTLQVGLAHRDGRPHETGGAAIGGRDDVSACAHRDQALDDPRGAAQPAAAGADAAKPRWAPPTRSSIECSFLNRLNRAAAAH